MTRSEAQVFFARRQEAWKAHDADALAQGHAVDGTLTSPMLGSLQGRESIKQSYEKAFLAFGDQQFAFDPILVDGDRVAQPLTVTITHTGDFMGLPGSGRRAQIQGIFIYDMTGDFIASEQRIYDFTSLLIQIGALRAKPAM